MRVYVETNFVLELALEQAQHASCEEVLRLGESGQVEIVLPAYSLVEPYETLARRHGQRRKMATEIDSELGQLIRTASYQQRLEGLLGLARLLVNSAEEESERLEEVRLRVLGACTLVPLDFDCLASSTAYHLNSGFSPPDAIVYAAVISHLESSQEVESCFLNRDKDFDDPDLAEEMRGHHCALIPSFDDGLSYIASHLAGRGGSS